VGRRIEISLRRLRELTATWSGDASPPLPMSRLLEVDAAAAALARVLAEHGDRLRQAGRERDELAVLVDAVGEGIVQLAPGGRITRANRAARQLLGLPSDAEGKQVAALIRHGALRRLLEDAAAGEALEPAEVPLDQLRLLVVARPLAGAGGAVVVLVDLTELRRLEDVRRDFVAAASHELKTPLTSIRGYTETLLADQVAPDTQQRFLLTIKSNAERLQRVVDDLLDLSRLESGTWVPEAEPVDLATVARETWTRLRERAAAREIRFRVAPDGAAVALADAGALGHIFSNLFDNAIRYTPPGGAVTVHVSTAPEEARRTEPVRRRPPRPAVDGERREAVAWVVVEVSDTGCGIPRDALPRIFERFYRVDPARSRAEGGTGLGLAIVKHLVESMGGDVVAESELGKGTIIRFRLPAVRAALASG
ncbi:MAG: PAS domain-containing protein, partial [Gemmatimonadetes bacterium]|nr:PAS domain-containing protein [Gemmatimonadota bacterium]